MMKRILSRNLKTLILVCGILGEITSGNAGSQEPLKKSIESLQELYLVTTYIEIFAGDTRVSTATGFFCLSDDAKRLFLITNRHVVRNEKKLFFPNRLRLWLHVDPSDLRRSTSYNVMLYDDSAKKQKRWREIDPSIDVVAIELPLQELGKFYFKALSPTQFAKEGTDLGIGEPVVIPGYPLGFFDEVHNLPVARQGAVASAFPIPFRGKPFFLVDANLHPGTSGSPVVSRPAGFGLTETGQRVFGPPFYLVGVISMSYGDLNLNAVWFTSVIEQLIK